MSVKNSIKLNNDSMGNLYCCFGAIFWGLNGTVSESFFRNYDVPSTWLAGSRMFFAGIILMIYIIVTKKVNFKAVFTDKRGLLSLAVFAIFGLLFCQLSYLTAISYSNSGTATMLQTLSVIIIAAVVCIRTRKLPSKKVTIGIILSVIGVAFIATGGDITSISLTPKGLIWGLLTALSAALYILLSKGSVERYGAAAATGMAMMMGGIVMFFFGRVWEIPSCIDGIAILHLLFIIVIGTVISFTFFIKGTAIAGPVKAEIFGCLEPLVAAILSALWLGSHFTLFDITGFACILFTVILLRNEKAA